MRHAAGRRRPLTDAEKYALAKKRERSVRQRQRLFRRLGAAALVAAAIGLVVWAAVAFANWSVFDIDRISVAGGSRVDVAAVRGVLGNTTDTTVLRASRRDIEAAVMRHPWVASAESQKRLPSTIAITVTERQPLARVVDGEAGEWVISTTGHWLGAWDGEGVVSDPAGGSLPVVFDAAKLVVIEGAPAVEPSAGKRTDSAEVLNAVAVLNGLTPELFDQVASVTAIDVTGTRVYTDSGVEILIGNAERIEAKSKLALSLLSAKEGAIALIDVRSTKPVWRGLDQ